MNVDRYTTPLAYSSSGSLVILGTQLADWAIAIGALCAVATAVVNWYYKRKEREDRLRGLVKNRVSDS